VYKRQPEQRAVYEEGIAQRRKMFDQTYDPERQRQEGLQQFLLGAGGRRYNVLGGAAQTAKGYDERQRLSKLRDFEGMQKSREELVGKEREGIKPSIEGGLKALEQYSMNQRGGLEAGYKRVEGELERTSRENTAQLDRASREAIARDNNRVQGMIAQAQREGTAAANSARISQEINRLESRELVALQDGQLAKTIASLEQMKAFNPKGFTPEQQAELDRKYKDMADAKKEVYLKMDAYREQMGGSKGGAKSPTGTPEQLAALAKYSKGK
jgi:hypothetical protein